LKGNKRQPEPKKGEKGREKGRGGGEFGTNSLGRKKGEDLQEEKGQRKGGWTKVAKRGKRKRMKGGNE